MAPVAIACGCAGGSDAVAVRQRGPVKGPVVPARNGGCDRSWQAAHEVDAAGGEPALCDQRPRLLTSVTKF